MGKGGRDRGCECGHAQFLLLGPHVSALVSSRARRPESARSPTATGGGIAVGLVISGEYFGWSYGWNTAGTLGFLAATVLVAAMYATFIFSFRYQQDYPHPHAPDASAEEDAEATDLPCPATMNMTSKR